MKKTNKLTIFLKSGHTIDVVCEDWEFKFDRETLEYIGYTIKGTKNIERISLVPKQIAGYIVNKK